MLICLGQAIGAFGPQRRSKPKGRELWSLDKAVMSELGFEEESICLALS